MRYTDDSALPEVGDEAMRQSLAQAVPYTLIILKAGPRYSAPGPDRDPEVARIIWRHGNRNFRLKAAGLLQVVCPVVDGGPITGVGVFAATPEEVDRIYSHDPAVTAGILTYEIHPTRTFAGSTLTEWRQDQ